MKTHTKTLLTAFAASAVLAGNANAAITQVSSSFQLGASGSDLAIDTTGTLDWGYLTSDFLGGDDVQTPTNFDSMTVAQGGSTVSSATSAIGAVFVHEDADSDTTTSAAFTGFTFDGNATDGVAGGIGGTEEIFTITFQDLGVGTREIKLYLGHTNKNRSFSADVYLGGDLSGTGTPDSTVDPGDIGEPTAFIYTLVVNVTDANDDVSISIDSTSGGTGAFQFSGYTVANVVPEPSSLALMGLGGLLIARRRRG